MLPRYKGRVQASSPARYRKGNKGVNSEYKSEILGRIEEGKNFTGCYEERRLQMRRSHRETYSHA
jgi:hypothetical protein